jgi:hypothetical protein
MLGVEGSKRSERRYSKCGRKKLMLKFNDGIIIDTSGKLRIIHLNDGYYVTGQGILIPVKDEQEARETLGKWKKANPQRLI